MCRPSKPASFPLQGNHSTEERFLLLGFSDLPSLQPVLFVLALLCYLLTLMGNSALVLLAVREPSPNTPVSLKGNTEVPGTTSFKPLLPS